MIKTDITEKILSSLTSVMAVSGNENRMFETIKSFFDGEVLTDGLGSMKFKTNGSSKKSFLLDSHVDQIGFVVTDITDGGFVKVGAVGGIDARILCAADVRIETEKGCVFGVVTSVPPHLSGKDEGEAPPVCDVLVDVGLTKAEARDLISVGDFVTFNYGFVKLANDAVSSPSLDNRAGVAVLIRTYQILKSECPEACVTFLFSSQEEAGMRGAKAASYAESADEAVVVDVSFSTAPNVDKSHAGQMGKGPMICISPIIDKRISDKLIMTAKENGIDFQTEICANATGTNADVISLSGNGVKTGLVSVPLRNMHTFSEVISLNDIELSARLIAQYIKRSVSFDD